MAKAKSKLQTITDKLTKVADKVEQFDAGTEDAAGLKQVKKLLGEVSDTCDDAITFIETLAAKRGGTKAVAALAEDDATAECVAELNTLRGRAFDLDAAGFNEGQAAQQNGTAAAGSFPWKSILSRLAGAVIDELLKRLPQPTDANPVENVAQNNADTVPTVEPALGNPDSENTSDR